MAFGQASRFDEAASSVSATVRTRDACVYVMTAENTLPEANDIEDDTSTRFPVGLKPMLQP